MRKQSLVFLGLHVKKAIAIRLKQIAKSEQRSVASYIRLVIEQDLKARERST